MLRRIVYAQSDTYPIALIIKEAAINQQEIENTYVRPLEAQGITRDDLLVVGAPYKDSNKAPITFIRAQLISIMDELAACGTKYIYCADANYFKALVNIKTKAEAQLGYALKCTIPGFEHMEVILGVNHKSLMYNDANEPKLNLSLDTLISIVNHTYTGLGVDIIKQAQYPSAYADIKNALMGLMDKPRISADIEAFSLSFWEAGIASISFAPDQEKGIAYAIDYAQYSDTFIGPIPDGHYGYQTDNHKLKTMLRDFLNAYPGVIIWQGSSYDLKVLIYELYMHKDFTNQEGLLQGLDALTKAFEDTKIIAYLATNSCSGNKLGLKELAHEFAGNWAKDAIKDVRLIPLPELLEYNLIDCLSTNYAFDKYYPRMVEDQQLELYRNLMLPSQKMLLQAEMTGMPLDIHQVKLAKQQLQLITKTHLTAAKDTPAWDEAEIALTENAYQKDFADRQKKAKNPENILPKDRTTFKTRIFNPNSSAHLRVLLHDIMGLPVLYRTKTKQPSTKAKHIKRMLNHTSNKDYIKLLNHLTDYALAEKILTTFIPAFEKAVNKDGSNTVWLLGNFNLNGAVSGRLSSSDPNLQNLPSGSFYGKLIKSCFRAPKEWLFCGADFDSLEDMISALTTKDPNKLKVYIDGYDGHCLRAYTYFKDDMIDIVDTVESINSIATLYPKLRQDSKAPTFALTYQGMWITLMNNLGWTEEKAKFVEANYHELYAVSTQWVADKLQTASSTGYVECAFGLRLRTPLLVRTLRNNKATPFEAEAEGRTAGNALGQSYGLLNNRAAVEFWEKVWNSPYRLQILPIALIHDAIYPLIINDVNVIAWANQELIKSMKWQELPEIKHDTVKLGAKLAIYWPSWEVELELPNNATPSEIRHLCRKHKANMLIKGQI